MSVFVAVTESPESEHAALEELKRSGEVQYAEKDLRHRHTLEILFGVPTLLIVRPPPSLGWNPRKVAQRPHQVREKTRRSWRTGFLASVGFARATLEPSVRNALDPNQARTKSPTLIHRF